MASPQFDKFTVLSFGRELKEVQSAVSGAPGGVVFDQRWDHDPFAEMRTLTNTVTGGPALNRWTLLDPQRRLNMFATATSMAWNSSPPTPLARSPFAYSLPANPPGKRAP